MAETNTIALDTCSLVNLINGNHLESVLNIPNIQYVITPGVYKEVCEVESQKEQVDVMINVGWITKWAGEIDVNALSDLYDKYSLGDGETESIALCISDSVSLCCDDWKARTAAVKEITDSRVLGSLRLLKMAVVDDVIKCTDARICYLEMRVKGGFLPKDVSDDYFCKAS